MLAKDHEFDSRHSFPSPQPSPAGEGARSDSPSTAGEGARG